MNHQCPICHTDLWVTEPTPILSKTQKIAFHWVHKSPLACPDCHSHLQTHLHPLESLHPLLNILLSLLLIYALNTHLIPQSYLWYSLAGLVMVLLLIRRVIHQQLTTWPRYQLFVAQTRREWMWGWVATVFLYLILLLPIVCGVWMLSTL
jgi:uncharacterized protein YbaR (Trm112 family)